MPHVPVKYLSHFVRGYFDGDGYVSVGKNLSGGKYIQVVICGPHVFLNGLQELMIEKLNVRRHKVCWTNRTYSMRWARRNDIKRLYNWLYPESGLPCLERKRLKMCEVF